MRSRDGRSSNAGDACCSGPQCRGHEPGRVAAVSALALGRPPSVHCGPRVWQPVPTFGYPDLKGSVSSVGTCGARQTPIASSPPLRPSSLSASERTLSVPNGPSVGQTIVLRSPADDRALHVSEPTSIPPPSGGTGRARASLLVTCSRLTMAHCGRLGPIAASLENDRSLLPNRFDPSSNYRAPRLSSSPRRMFDCHGAATNHCRPGCLVRDLRAPR